MLLKSLQLHKKVCKRNKPQKKTCKSIRGRPTGGRGRGSNTLTESDTSETEDEAEVEEDDDDDLETVSNRPTFSVQGDGGVETILNLREWLKCPWSENE